mgnify:CR=1 FL=1
MLFRLLLIGLLLSSFHPVLEAGCCAGANIKFFPTEGELANGTLLLMEVSGEYSILKPGYERGKLDFSAVSDNGKREKLEVLDLQVGRAAAQFLFKIDFDTIQVGESWHIETNGTRFKHEVFSRMYKILDEAKWSLGTYTEDHEPPQILSGIRYEYAAGYYSSGWSYSIRAKVHVVDAGTTYYYYEEAKPPPLLIQIFNEQGEYCYLPMDGNSFSFGDGPCGGSFVVEIGETCEFRARIMDFSNNRSPDKKLILFTAHEEAPFVKL